MVVGRLVEGGGGRLEGAGEGGWRRQWVRKKCERVRVMEESRHDESCYRLCLQAFLRVEKLLWLTHVTTSGF